MTLLMNVKSNYNYLDCNLKYSLIFFVDNQSLTKNIVFIIQLPTYSTYLLNLNVQADGLIR